MKMIKETYYLSDPKNAEKLSQIACLSIDEIELIVSRFGNRSWRSGHLKGEVVVYMDDSISIRHHFTKKIICKL